ncbi:hypothetical protein [Phocaeicola plebeius]|jgi:hypothetical protein|uniref:hypothetical protein n=1 Tax=uncultured Bacteroides sp. TaxID=162156 RepID=UPI00280C032D|nr:hypothetical protein [uncultured Bacteroides sp.]CAJ1882023.1 hypothetical protein AUSP0032_00032 [uncultured phage]
MRNVDIDVMREILEEHGILVNEDVAKSITEDFVCHLEVCREMDASQFRGCNTESDTEKIMRLEAELKKVKRELSKASTENEVYRDNVMKRHNASSVWIEDGVIKYSYGV